MKRKRYNPNIWRGLTVDIKRKLCEAILEAILRVMREQRRKTHPPMELIVEFVSTDVRRLVERLGDGLVRRHIEAQYFILYKGSGSQRAVKVVKLGVEDMVALKRVIELHKPNWASRSEAYPLSYPLSDDKCFPFVCFWPQIKPHEKVPHASI